MIASILLAGIFIGGIVTWGIDLGADGIFRNRW